MKFPNPDVAYIDPVKLRDYCLNFDHPRGKHNARVFEAKFGIRQQDWKDLSVAIQLKLHDGLCVEDREDQYGKRFYLDMVLSLKGRSAEVRTSWILRTGENFARLTSCYVKS